MKNGPFKVGIIGVGGIAESQHIPGWRSNPEVEIAAVADINLERARTVASRFGIEHVFADYRKLCELDLDAVDICTPNRVHPPAALAALEAGKHVLCEKPLAVTSDEVRRVGEMADRLGLKLMTGHHFRFGAPATAIGNWIGAGNLGEVYHARVRWMRRAYVPTSAGFIDASLSGGGPCMDLGVHVLDLCLWFMGFPRPVRVAGTTRTNFAKGHRIPGMWGEWDRKAFSVEDFAAAFVHFENGATLLLECAWLGHQTETEEMDCQLFGLEGGVKWPAAEFASVCNGAFVQGTLLHPQRIEYPIRAELKAFYDCVVGDLPSPVPWRETFDVIRILEGIYASGRQGREVIL